MIHVVAKSDSFHTDAIEMKQISREILVRLYV